MRSRFSDRYRSRRGGSRSRRDWSRSSDRYRSRRDRSRRARSRSFDCYRSRRERARSPARRGSGAVVRDRTLSRIARGQACDYLLLLPACGPWQQDGWPDVGPRSVWRRWSLSLLWPGAAAGVPPVSGGASIAALPSVFAGACQVLHELVWLLFPGSTWSSWRV